MDIGIIGSGRIGSILVRHLAALERGSPAAVRRRTSRHVRSLRRTTPAQAEFRQADVALSSRFLSIGKKESATQ